MVLGTNPRDGDEGSVIVLVPRATSSMSLSPERLVARYYRTQLSLAHFAWSRWPVSLLWVAAGRLNDDFR